MVDLPKGGVSDDTAFGPDDVKLSSPREGLKKFPTEQLIVALIYRDVSPELDAALYKELIRYVQICDGCNMPFIPRHGNRKNCSEECAKMIAKRAKEARG